MQHMYHRWPAALALGLCLLTAPAVAQEPSPAPQAAERTEGAARVRAETEADRALAERIRQSLQENAPLSGAAQAIRLRVADGEVTLRGEVKTAEEREGIEAQVRRIQGVQAVRNRLRVAGAEREAAGRPEEGEESLRAAVECFVRAENARDLDTLLALAHDQVVFVGPLTSFPAEGTEAYRQAWQALFAHERFAVTLTNPQVRALGPTGVAWGLYTLRLKPQDGPLTTTSGRYTLTFTRADGAWRLVAFHASRLPSEPH
jgi:hyperosmotically inducible protein